MAIIHQKDKRSGITYAYEAAYYWDKEKQQSRSKRKLIGRIDPQTGQILPTDGRMKKSKEKPSNQINENTFTRSTRSFYGATYLLDAIGDKLGITNDLKTCFPEAFKQILSIAYYLILEDSNPLFRFEKWGSTHKHPFGKDISSQRSSELFMNISEEAKNHFFEKQGKRRIENEYWAYDTSSISSYSETLRQVQYGKNKENDKLPQLNLALVFGEQSNLPFYYRKLAGNIPDVKTVQHLISDLELLGLKKIKLVMDRGFYSKDNIDALYGEHLKFLVSTSTSLSLIRDQIDAIYDDFDTFRYYNDDYELYTTTIQSNWNYTKTRPIKGDSVEEKRRIYIHLYYNIDKAVEDQKNFDKKLFKLKNELLEGKRNSDHENLYKKYFTVKSTPIRGIQISVNEDAVKKDKRYYGFFSLISNETMDSITALQLYRNKDVVEKAFGNLKDRLNMRRTLVSSEKSLDGKLFVEFIALIYLSYIKKQMQDQKLFKEYTLQGMLDKLDIIECFENEGHKLRIGEILEKQKGLYLKLGVEPPCSS